MMIGESCTTPVMSSSKRRSSNRYSYRLYVSWFNQSYNRCKLVHKWLNLSYRLYVSYERYTSLVHIGSVKLCSVAKSEHCKTVFRDQPCFHRSTETRSNSVRMWPQTTCFREGSPSRKPRRIETGTRAGIWLNWQIPILNFFSMASRGTTMAIDPQLILWPWSKDWCSMINPWCVAECWVVE